MNPDLVLLRAVPAWNCRPLLAALSGLALMAGLAAPAAAQTLPGAAPAGLRPNEPTPTVADNDDLDQASNGVAGLPGYPGRGFHLSADVLTRYEDNLSRRPVKDDGLRIRPRATASYGLGAGRVGLYVTGTYGRDIIVGNSLFPSADRHNYGAGLSAQLSRCNVDAGASYARNLVFTTDIAAFGGLEQKFAQGGATLACRIGSALAVQGGVNYADIGVTRAITAAFDSRRWTYSGAVSFSRPALGRISLEGTIADTALTGRQVLTPGGLVDDGLLQRSVRLGWTRDFGSRLSLTAGASYIDTGPKDPQNIIVVDGVQQVVDRGSFNGAGYDASLAFRMTPALTLNVRAGRAIRVNNFVGAQFIVADNLQISAAYRMRGNLVLQAGWDQLDSRFRGTVITSLEAQRRNRDNFDRYFASINSRLGRRLKLALEVSHNQRRSDPAIFSFDSTGVGLTLGFELGKK